MRFRLTLLLFLIGSTASPAALPDPRVDKLDSLIAACHQAGLFHGNVMVTEGDQILYAASYGMADEAAGRPHVRRDRFMIGSVSKQFTSMLVFQAHARGLLDIRQPLCAYLPEFAKNAPKVRLYHLLTHSSGLPDFTLVPGYWTDSVHIAYPRHTLIGRMNRPPAVEPGSSYAYNNGGYYLLAHVLEKVSGRSYVELLQDWILDPLNMRQSGVYGGGPRPEGLCTAYSMKPGGYKADTALYYPNSFGAGQLYSTADDLRKWHQGLKGSRLLPDSLKKWMWEPFLQGYACGWQVRYWQKNNGDPLNVQFHGGLLRGYHTFFNRVVSDDLCIILLDNHRSPSLFFIDRAIRHILLNEPYRLPETPFGHYLLSLGEPDLLDLIYTRFDGQQDSYTADFACDEMEINRAGYLFMRAGRLDEAVQVLDMNRRLFPDAYNVYDSLGEAYLLRGDSTAAKEHYQTSLLLNPENNSAIEALKHL